MESLIPTAPRGAGRSPEQTREAIEAFLKHAKQPALLEPGEELLELTEDNFSLEIRGSRLTLQAWDRTRNLTRRITEVQEPALGETAGRLEMTV